MNRLLLGAAVIALGTGALGSAHAQTTTGRQPEQPLQPAACTQTEVGQVANRVAQLKGAQAEQAQQLVQRAQEAMVDGDHLRCRQLLVQTEAMLPGGAQVTKEQPLPGFLGGPESASSGGGRSGQASGHMQEAAIQADDVVAALRQSPQFSTLVGLIETAGLADTLREGGPYTIFAPTNQAFEKLPQNVRDQLSQERNRDNLRTVLSQHVIKGRSIASNEIPKEIEPMGGEPIEVSIDNNRPRLHMGERHEDMTGERHGDMQATGTQPSDRQQTANVPGEAQREGMQAVREARASIQGAERELSAANAQQPNDAGAQQSARNRISEARQAIDRALAQPAGNNRQPLEQARTALDNADKALQSGDRPAAQQALADALQPLPAADESMQPSRQGQMGTRRTETAESDRATITVGDIRTRNGYVRGIDTVLVPESVEQALAQ